MLARYQQPAGGFVRLSTLCLTITQEAKIRIGQIDSVHAQPASVGFAAKRGGFSPARAAGDRCTAWV
jgi:hypothetical protein